MKRSHRFPFSLTCILTLMFGLSLLFWVSPACKNAQKDNVTPTKKHEERFENFIDEYVEFIRSPFLRGIGTASEYTDRANKLREWLAKLDEIPRDGLTLDQDIDYRLISSDLKTKIAEIERERRWEKNPGIYIPFSRIYSLVTSENLPLEERGQQLLKSLEEVPQSLTTGKDNLKHPPLLFFNQSIDTLKTVLQFYQEDIPHFCRQIPSQEKTLMEAHRKALASLEDYQDFLENDLKSRADGTLSIGPELYNYYLKERYMLDETVDSLIKRGEKYFADTIQSLEETARMIDASKTWQELIQENRKNHPTAEDLLAEWDKTIQRARKHVISRSLVTVPEGESVQCVPMPPSRRKLSPFGLMSTPRPFSDSKIGRLMINPVEPDLPKEEQEKLLRSHDYTFITTIAPHETYPGHHLHALKNQENPRIFRKIFRSPLFGEGWGLYAEELMHETGFFENSGRTRLTQLRTRLWRAARVILDAKLHTEQISYDEARKFLEEKVLFEPVRTAGEVNLYTGRPTYVATYIIGYYDIMQLREDYKKKKGKEFTLLEFHEAMLKTGSLPTSLLREVILAGN